ncbi:hypothetical protein TanjilG_05818 [Lupinus angustifolius]|uniref:VQ domain-containing protein n=1 Tax=Lupinus angustifolius TaxID=3871 RepID=A0A4P1R3P2_LUPAN|nr:PREDICTED: protein MKS1-like isoform X1 [Lupinus angustifolius]OIW00468.1 hypothetical protein TanjilG_05818 [Lupinus angustifolius]
MNLPEFPSGIRTSSASSKKEVQLQGPRPPPLRVNKESHRIRKPPLPPPTSHHQPPPDHRKPVIIYSVSPQAINVTVNDFMNTVQRLTGPSSGNDPTLRSGDVSPAARFASIEKTSPSEKERAHGGGDDDMTWLLEGVEMGQFPGILSPPAANIPPISSGYFPAVTELQQTTSYWYDLSPFWSSSSFVMSPSGLLSAAVVSPLPSPDLFNLFK